MNLRLITLFDTYLNYFIDGNIIRIDSYNKNLINSFEVYCEYNVKKVKTLYDYSELLRYYKIEGNVVDCRTTI